MDLRHAWALAALALLPSLAMAQEALVPRGVPARTLSTLHDVSPAMQALILPGAIFMGQSHGQFLGDDRIPGVQEAFSEVDRFFDQHLGQ